MAVSSPWFLCRVFSKPFLHCSVLQLCKYMGFSWPENYFLSPKDPVDRALGMYRDGIEESCDNSAQSLYFVQKMYLSNFFILGHMSSLGFDLFGLV